MSIELIAPEYDIRFDPERAALNDEYTPQEWTEATVDLTIRNYHSTGDYLESLREPSVATTFHATLIDGMHRIGDAIDDRRDAILDAESFEELEVIYAEFQALDSELTEELRASAAASPPSVMDALSGRTGECLERLRIDSLSAQD